MASALTRTEISLMRRAYGEKGLEGLPLDPFTAFSQWLAEAHANPVIVEANAMVITTLDKSMKMTTRTVLLKDVTEQGFTFFTNYNSRKARAINDNPNVTLLFPWYAMERQVSITGVATKVARSESELYFSSRPWSSKIGAWASDQSAPLASREDLEIRWKEAALKWPEGTEVPTPEHWGGFRVAPDSIEFWQGRNSRLHDRLRFNRAAPTDVSPWTSAKYFP